MGTALQKNFNLMGLIQIVIFWFYFIFIFFENPYSMYFQINPMVFSKTFDV